MWCRKVPLFRSTCAVVAAPMFGAPNTTRIALDEREREVARHGVVQALRGHADAEREPADRLPLDARHALGRALAVAVHQGREHGKLPLAWEHVRYGTLCLSPA
ncbi:hypothetical protein WMF45_45265 [Sorangium sp. So ce448]